MAHVACRGKISLFFFGAKLSEELQEPTTAPQEWLDGLTFEACPGQFDLRGNRAREHK